MRTLTGRTLVIGMAVAQLGSLLPHDARSILLCGSIVSGLATILFGLLANFAGAYMPGLKALTDRLEPGDSSRSITLYTSSFSVGVGISFLVAQLVAGRWGWRPASS